MRIAQIAPLFESVPPKYYGGTERVVSYLTEELVNQGHDVTLFASGDSHTKAKIRAACHRSLRLDKKCVDRNVHFATMLELLYKEASQYDIIHSHIDYLPFSQFRRMSTANVTTLHGRLDYYGLEPLFKEFKDIPVISISLAQRDPLPHNKWVGNVHHGIPKSLFALKSGPGKYLAFLGRICPEKRVDIAIEIAKKAEMPLKIAAKVDQVDQLYFEQSIKPLLDHPLITYIGEIGEAEKQEFLGNAYALLFPIDWPEPFGLVLIEAWACGTPVIARARGSVPELMKEGVTGYVCEDVSEAVQAIKKVTQFDRQNCRLYFEKHFTAKIMTENYVKIYQNLIDNKKKSKLKLETV